MARIKTEHRAGLDFLDQVLFHDLVVHIGMDWRERGQLKTIISRVREMVEARCTGRDVEIITHLAYYFLEISLANTMDEWRQAATFKVPDPVLPKETVVAVHEHTKAYQSAWMLVASQLTTGVDGVLALQIAETLNDEFAGYSPLVRRDLVRRCFAYEFQDASLSVYCWLVIAGVLPVTKTDRERLHLEFSERFLTRLSLLADFESLMHALCMDIAKTNTTGVFLGQPQFDLKEKTVDRLLNIQKTFHEALNKKSLSAAPVLCKPGVLQHTHEHVQNFFKKLGMRKVRLRMHNGSLASWLGVLGASLVEQVLMIEYENAACEQFPNGPGIVNKADLKVRAIFNALDNQGTITDSVKNRLSTLGFTINPDTLYRVHSAMNKSTLYMIDLYCKTTRDMGMVMSSLYEDPHYGGIFIHADRMAVNSGASPGDEQSESDT